MSKLVITREIIVTNNGTHKSQTGKCGTISLSQGTATDIDFLNEYLELGEHDQLDFYKLKNKLQELSDLLGFEILLHTAQNLEKGTTRILLDPLETILPRNTETTYRVHILWYGAHFEYVKWEKINDYPEYDKTIYDIVKTFSDNAEELLYNYTLNICI